MSSRIWRGLGLAFAAWQEQRKGPARPTSYEPEFLPAALEVIETPPSPAARTLLLGICVMTVAALAWSIFGRVDIVVVGPGKTIPRDRVQIVSWSGSSTGIEGTAGIVRAIRVGDGDRVQKGQVLLELDPTINSADAAQATQGLASATTEAARLQAIVDYLRNGKLVVRFPSNLSAPEAAVQRRLIESMIAEYEAKAAELRQARAQRAAELEAALAERSKLKEMLVPLEQEMAIRSELAAKGYQPKISVYQLQQVKIERRGNIQLQESAAAKARAAMAEIEQQLRGLRENLTKTSLTELAKASDDIVLRREEMRKASRRNALLQIRAPVAGTVEQLQAHTIGGIIEPAHPILTIVPAESALLAEAQVENQDIGFIRVGQPVALKIAAYPFTQYGLVRGTVVSIGRDAISTDTRSDLSGADGATAHPLVYVVRIHLEDPTILDAACRQVRVAHTCPSIRLRPGMSLQAEIKTGQRRIIDYLISPLTKATQEAGRER